MVGQLVIVSRSKDKLESARLELLSKFNLKFPASSIVIHVVVADLSSNENCISMVNSAVNLMGGLDYLILNHITYTEYGLWLTKKSKDNGNFITKVIYLI